MPYESPTATNLRDQPLVNQLCAECRSYIAARDPSLTTAISQNIQQLFVLTGLTAPYLAPYFNDVI
jgi:hypothetical protein